MIFRLYESARRWYDRLTFGIKMAIAGTVGFAVLYEYRQIRAGQTDLSVSGEPNSRIEALAVSVSKLIE